MVSRGKLETRTGVFPAATVLHAVVILVNRIERIGNLFAGKHERIYGPVAQNRPLIGRLRRMPEERFIPVLPRRKRELGAAGSEFPLRDAPKIALEVLRIVFDGEKPLGEVGDEIGRETEMVAFHQPGKIPSPVRIAQIGETLAPAAGRRSC